MSRRLDVINFGDPSQRPAPRMMSSCETGGCGGGPDPMIPPPPTFSEVRVNGVEITPEAIAQEIQHHPAPDAETAWTEAARALAVKELLLQEARRLGLKAEPEQDDAGRSEAEDDALVRSLLELEVVPSHPGKDECRRFYDAYQERFRTPDLFDAAHILIEPEADDEAGWAAAEKKARLVREQIGNGAAAFAKAARTHSGCASAQQDGSLGQVRRGELVAVIQEELESLGDGETGCEPIRSRFGWHLLRLHRRIPGRTIPFEMACDKIVDTLEARSWSVESARYVAGLAARGSVEGILIEGAG
ncbi:peptidylprolyl isomerase [Sphingomonas sp.]|uniref:peptidylprolyl isomerase n=1 Tax=Sphingomonas sp. TaxID=28214 RepID=UPI0025F7A6BB|nr:peptidylprolyl isomerase [Sphingomonas sp.]